MSKELSLISINSEGYRSAKKEKVVGPPGFEPGISAMSRRRHNQLDHGPQDFSLAPV